MIYNSRNQYNICKRCICDLLATIFFLVHQNLRQCLLRTSFQLVIFRAALTPSTLTNQKTQTREIIAIINIIPSTTAQLPRLHVYFPGGRGATLDVYGQSTNLRLARHCVQMTQTLTRYRPWLPRTFSVAGRERCPVGSVCKH